ncbi:microtubule-associated protein tau-like isoform X2 [Coccinella septempunctata]|uniref:microtubule-associated protein tau-like isoform X2 n=1 Tax=Coccinella septempunctata TaxID=41139 RepID=UPI001D071243|nr:microtubule-associated protein tau-like isoform X2 [Coccinella septempunctata]
MSQPTNNVFHHPETERAESFKDQEKLPSEGIKQFPNGNNTPPAGYPPRPPLTRIDSRSSFPIRPGFPNPQQIRPPGQQIRPPPPGTAFIQRPPGATGRPPFQQGFPNNQINQNIRLGGPNIRPPGGPFPPGAFPRGIPPGARIPNLIHQRSDPNSEHQKIGREHFTRSQTLESTDINSSPPGNANMEMNEHANANWGRSTPPKSASSSLHSSTTNLNEDPSRTFSRKNSIDERRLTGSQESLERKSEHEYPSRPESRSSSRMSQILENFDAKNINGTSYGDSSIQRADSRSSINLKASPSVTSLTRENINENPVIDKPNDNLASKTDKEKENNSHQTERSEATTPQSQTDRGSNLQQTETSRASTPQAKTEKRSNLHQTETNRASTPQSKTKIESHLHQSEINKASTHQTKTEKDSNIQQVESNESSTPQPKAEKANNVETKKKSLQIENLTKAKSSVKIEGDNDSGVDESTQGNDQSSNGDASSPRKSASKAPKRVSSATPSKSRSLSRDSKSPSLKSPDSNATTPGTTERKKLPMNRVQVGSAPSPNLKEVRSKIGSLQNATHKPGGGNIKIETKKIELKNVTPRIEAKNDKYIPKGGEKKIISQKLQWNAKPKVGSLDNASHKPVSSGKKIETIKLDFKEKAKPKVGSKDNMKHVPGGGDVKNSLRSQPGAASGADENLNQHHQQ